MMHDIEFYQAEREKLVEQTITSSMEIDQEFYPFSSNNFEEALSNFSHTTYILLSSYAHTANKLDTDVSRDLMAMAFLRAINDYWLKYATEDAENIVPSAEELRDNAKAEHLDMQSELARDRRMGI